MTISFPTRRSADLEATLPHRQRVVRRPLYEDDLRVGIGVPCQRPVEFAPVVAVDENEVLPDRHEVERIDPLPRRGDEIALLVTNVVPDQCRRVIVPADRTSTRLNSSH